MDLSTSDFDKLLTNLERAKDILDWQSSEPTPSKVLPLISKSITLLKSYLDPDEISVEQLLLAFPEPGDEEDYDEYNH